MASVLFIAEAGESSCAWYRAIQPAYALECAGWDVAVRSVLVQREDGRIVGWDGQSMSEPADVVVCRRMNGPDGELWSNAAMFRQAREAGQKVFVDLDDDPWNLPRYNPAYGTMTPDQLAMWADDMTAATGVIVSTPALGLSVADHVGDVPVTVCRNGINMRLFQRNMVERDPIRLGWTGTTDYRGTDLAEAVPGLREALDGKFGRVEFWHIGARNDLPSVHEILGPRFPVQVFERPWVPIGQFAAVLQQIDVAIVPQLVNLFSQARSNVTGLALCAAGVPFAATQTDEYARLWVNGGGYSVPDAAGWARAVHVLTAPEYCEVRHEIRSCGLVVADRWGLRFIASEYAAAFASAGVVVG